ncbi:MAG: P-type conjugative transfer protein TrbL [Syntrophobacterales bacterium]|jgi:type IV secretion system protein TrbL|nr:P-type conjugative transfer protein TrbL [Syntrophobacterales bacterium]
MTPDVGILTIILKSFGLAFINGIGFIHGDAKWLLGTLIVIDLVLAVVLNLSDGDHMKTLIQKTLKYGFFIWIVMDYKMLINTVSNTFSAIGLKAGGGSLSSALLTDPSALADQGIILTAPIFDHIKNIGVMDMMKNLSDIAFTGLVGLLIVFLFFIISIQIFITYLEFYVVSTLALILLPFGVNRRTAFLGEKAIGAVLSFGIKLMVLAFIAAVSIPLVQTWTLPVDPTLQQDLCLLLGSLAITFLAWHAPTVATSLLSGSPSLTAGTAASAAASAGSAAATLGGAAAGVAKQGYNAVKAAAGGISQTAGAAKEGKMRGEGRMGGVAGLAAGYISKGINTVTESLKSSYNTGRRAVADPDGFIKSSGGAGKSPPSRSGSSSAGWGSFSGTSGMDYAAMKTRMNHADNKVPPSATKGSAKPDPKGDKS